MPAKKTALILGDIFTIATLTFIGFATHGEAAVSFLPRMGLIFLPLLVGWFLIAPWFGLFDELVIVNPKLLWRTVLAMFFVAPLAAIVRAALLHSSALPIFVLVLGGTHGPGMLVWRAIYIFIYKQNKK